MEKIVRKWTLEEVLTMIEVELKLLEHQAETEKLVELKHLLLARKSGMQHLYDKVKGML